ncbi:HNH endonuclease [Priestia megaterium]|uniref:HNH endonuclease n=1 Tax=Priestia megaterium TaxID=1404 RepID=UPI001596CA1B|nr:HNH endonuclease [Priestia megaterium]
MTKKKFCSCGKLVEVDKTCSCKETTNRNEYQKQYYKKNKDTLKPLSSTRWRKLRSLIIKRDGSCCQRCLVKYKMINSAQLQVHHIKPRIEHPELMFEESNLLTLCKTCNLQIGLKELDFEPTTDLKNHDFDFKL